MQDSSLIEWGSYKSEGPWFGYTSFDDKRFQAFFKDVKSKPELFDKHSLYLTGSIFEDWVSWDVDFVITGPYIPSKILPAMDWITKLGFEHGIYPDAVYVEEFFDLHEWQQNPMIQRFYSQDNKSDILPDWARVKRWVYFFSDTFIKNGNKKNMSGGEWQDGMYRMLLSMPYTKNYKKVAEGHRYKKALKVF